ncbi:MAG: tRNA pseudouridine(38-40) synthase TruA [Candidatus Berkiella sp.]
MQKIALGIEYDGSAYCGWQRQQHSPSVQERVEAALMRVANHPVDVFCAGRTDAKVHASNQVVHFESPSIRPEHAWVMGANSHLPKDIRVLWCRHVSLEFDARKSAIFRRYCYVISNRKISPGIMNNAMTWVFADLCVDSMHKAAQFLVGNHDFTSFRGSQCQAKTALRTVHAISISRKNDMIVLDITANAFLHHMVRNIAGSLIAVGKKKHPPHWLKAVLEAKDRRLAGMMAPPHGLYLVDVSYPNDFMLPRMNALPWFLDASQQI